MACGKPVILTRTAGLWSNRLLRDGENVLLVPPGDSEAMCGAIDRIFADSLLEARLGTAGREIVCRELTMRHYAERLEALIERTVLPAEGRRS
jgi:glycosyltransferase involved in cell wall biosynthesis